MDVFTEVKSILAGMGVPPDDIRPAASLVIDLALDSLEMVELVTQMEDKFGVQISDGVMSGGMTVGDVVDVVRRCLGE